MCTSSSSCPRLSRDSPTGVQERLVSEVRRLLLHCRYRCSLRWQQQQRPLSSVATWLHCLLRSGRRCSAGEPAREELRFNPVLPFTHSHHHRSSITHLQLSGSVDHSGAPVRQQQQVRVLGGLACGRDGLAALYQVHNLVRLARQVATRPEGIVPARFGAERGGSERADRA